MMLSDSSIFTLCEGSKTSLYLRLTLNLKNIIDLIYKYSENKKWKKKINSEGDF